MVPRREIADPTDRGEDCGLAVESPGLFVHRLLGTAAEFLRAISGLSAILVLAAIMVGLTLQGESQAGLRDVPSARTPNVVRDVPASQTVIFDLQKARTPPVHVFYLVATQGQESSADWGEQVGQMEAYSVGLHTPDRRYTILYARSDPEESAAAHAILEAVSEAKGGILVQVIDLRGVTAAQ